ncbi:MAG: hypothetical protein RLZZ511_3855 [Cyanobacteriota bacterium]
MPPVRAEGRDPRLFELIENRGQIILGPIEQVQGLHVLIKVTGLGRTEAEGMDFRVAEAEEIVEYHGTERRTEIDEFRRWGVEMTAFVRGADDEYPHVAGRGQKPTNRTLPWA